MTDREFLYCIVGCPLAALWIWAMFYMLFCF